MKFQMLLIGLLAIGSCAALPFFDDLSNLTRRLEDRISSAIGQFRRSMGELVQEVNQFRGNLDEVAHCFESELGGRQLNIFDNQTNFFDIVREYYVSLSQTILEFPNKY